MALSDKSWLQRAFLEAKPIEKDLWDSFSQDPWYPTQRPPLRDLPVYSEVIEHDSAWKTLLSTPTQALLTRLRVPKDEHIPKVKHLHVYATKTKVFVFLARAEGGVVLEDDVNTFPSDTMIASIKLSIA